MLVTIFWLVGNVLKEICEPEGAKIYADSFQLGDDTINILELWGAEYQVLPIGLSQPINCIVRR